MAGRRMFSHKIVSSDAFLDMPISTQALYFHLGMEADDDGFVNPKKVMRTLGVADDDLKVLKSKRFVLAFESGVIVIKHWKINNMIRKDFYQETVYSEEKQLLDVKKNKAYTEKDTIDCLQNVNNLLPQDRLGKVRIGNIGNEVAEGRDSKKEETFSFEVKFQSMKDNPRVDIKIIALYWQFKGFNFDNEEQYQSALKRDLIAANALKGYNSKQITETMEFCDLNFTMWTLETVGKRITDVIKQ